MNRRPRLLLAVIAMAGVLLLAGCNTTSIADINRDPGRYANKDVTISGRVSDAFGALGNGVFHIDDGTGQIWVFTNFGIPANGAQVDVTGRIQQGFNFGGKNYGLVLRETEQRR